MSINSKMRLSILASAFALAAAAPAAFAQGTGTWYQGIHTDPKSGSVDHDSAIHTKQLMEKKVVPSTPAGSEPVNSIQLTDGSAVHVFADGKMAMESPYGRAAYMEPGQVMQAKDGKKIIMNGNEAYRVDRLRGTNVSRD